MERTPVKSSLIRAAAFDAVSQTLEIEFMPSKKQGAAPGPVYRYFAVEQEKFVALIGENEYKSAGKYFLKVIKPHHKAEKVEETRAGEEKETH